MTPEKDGPIDPRVKALIEAVERRRRSLDDAKDEDERRRVRLEAVIFQLGELMNFAADSGVPRPALTLLVEHMGDLVQSAMKNASAPSRSGNPRKVGLINESAKKAQASAAVTKLMQAGMSEDAACRAVVQSVGAVIHLGSSPLGNYRKRVMQWVRPHDGTVRRLAIEVAADAYSAALVEVEGMPPRDGATVILEALRLHPR